MTLFPWITCKIPTLSNKPVKLQNQRLRKYSRFKKNSLNIAFYTVIPYKKTMKMPFDTVFLDLKSNKPIGMPTETVYGLAANALSNEAVSRIYELKKRPIFNPLIIHVTDISQAEKYVIFTDDAKKLADVFWPGPLTFVLNKKKNCPISDLASAGLETLAIRSPNHNLAQKILKSIDFPLAAPSANISESISPTKAEHVSSAFPNLTILDGGPCTQGLESTILDLSGKTPSILRPGTITSEKISNILGKDINKVQNKSKTIKSPGQLKRHYAPSIPVRLNAIDIKKGEILLSFGHHNIKTENELNLSVKGNLREAAANLFSYLRQLDSGLHKSIAVMPIPKTGLGIAINDRLTRASF